MAKVKIWELATGNILQTVDGNKNDSRMIAFVPDGKVLVTVGLDEDVNFWDIPTGSRRRSLKVALTAISALSPDGTWLAYCKGPKTFISNLKLSKVDDYVFDGDATDAKAVVFSPDSSLLATGDGSGVLRIYEPAKENLKVPQKGHESAIACVAFSTEGSVIGTASRDQTAKLWDTEGKELAKLAGHEGSVEVIALGPEAKAVLTGGKDGTARLWDGKSGKELFKFDTFQGKPESRIAISKDGSLAAIDTADGCVEVFETSSGTPVGKIDVTVNAFGFGPTGDKLFFGLSNGKLYTWYRGMQ
jgi:WD40 repeat protein